VELVTQALTGNRYALARLISLIEDDGPEARAALEAVYPHTGRAYVVGVTGAPGTGKSTLVNELAKLWRSRDTTVGIVAVDPSSPFSNGALLGDRVRMHDLVGDPGVFIRSMATRGHPGGLARSTGDVIKVLDAAGFAIVLIETVGAGQAEVEIARTAHTVIVVEAPGLGDEVQALKAGLLEIADVLVVNKADRPGAAQTALALEMAVGRYAVNPGNRADEPWRPPILQTVALNGTGVPEVLEAIEKHRLYLHTTGRWAQREHMRARAELLNTLQQEVLQLILTRVGEEQLQHMIRRIVAREMDTHSAAHTLLSLLEA